MLITQAGRGYKNVRMNGFMLWSCVINKRYYLIRLCIVGNCVVPGVFIHCFSPPFKGSQKELYFCIKITLLLYIVCPYIGREKQGFSNVFFLVPSPPQKRGKECGAGWARPRPTG